MTTPSSNAICQALKKAGIPYESHIEGVEPFSVNDPKFETICNAVFSAAIEEKFSVWTPEQIQEIENYIRQNQLPVKMRISTSLGALQPPLATDGQSLVLSIFAPATFKGAELFCGLEHESGHIHDFNWMVQQFPKDKEVIGKNRKNRTEFVHAITIFLDVMQRNLTVSDRKRFAELRSKAFYKFDELTIHQIALVYKIVAELLRWGDDIHKDCFKSYSLSGSTAASTIQTYFGTITPIQAKTTAKIENATFEIELMTTGMAAALQEAGFWDKVQRHKDFDPDRIRHLDPKKIEFFRLAIRGASAHFSKSK